jgi:uncharacterized protein GlcG (DUF336 family)
MRIVTSDVAARLVRACREAAERAGTPVAVVVLDHSREMVHLERMDGCPPMPTRVAVAKAFTSVSLGLESDGPMAGSQPGGELFGLQATEGLPISTIGGGVPLLADGVICGSIGVSGGTVDEDKAVAHAGLAAWKEM